MQARVVVVKLDSRSYEIHIGQDILAGVGGTIQSSIQASHAVLIADENVRNYASVVESSLGELGIRTNLLTVPRGESSKSVTEADRLWNELLAARTDRKSLVIAIGGGVVGDLAGFIAATFARGLRFVQIPTTLLAHVDSSVGGKVAVNLPSAKNMVGAFWQPQLVVIDVATLSTLPDREFRAGLAEVVKYGVIMDADFFESLERDVDAINDRSPEVLSRIIARCCELKAEVVADDERETTGRRAILNYGHTFCHAIESASGYGRFLHGEAVSIGMICASKLAERLGRIDSALTNRQLKLLESLSLPVELPKDLDSSELLELMRGDKKVEHGKLRFVLPTRMGHVELVGGVDERLVLQSLQSD